MNGSVVILSLVCGVSAVVPSEICYIIYCYIRDGIIQRQKRQVEINEVLMFNELSESCAKQHLQSPKIVICNNKHCAQKNINRITSLMDAAVYSIDVAIYTLTSYLIENALKRAKRRGVSVRIISDPEMAHSSGSSIYSLNKINIPARGPKTTYMMHHKFCIIDGAPPLLELKHLNQSRRRTEPQGLVITGSVNWTRQGFGGNWENFIITSNEQIVNKFQTEFERMWQKFTVIKMPWKLEPSAEGLYKHNLSFHTF